MVGLDNLLIGHCLEINLYRFNSGGIDVDKIKQIETLKLNHLGYDISSSIETDGMKKKTVIQQVKGEL